MAVSLKLGDRGTLAGGDSRRTTIRHVQRPKGFIHGCNHFSTRRTGVRNPRHPADTRGRISFMQGPANAQTLGDAAGWPSASAAHQWSPCVASERPSPRTGCGVMIDTKGNGPDAANDRPAETQTKDARILGALPAHVNLDEWDAGRGAREAAENARVALLRRNSAAIARIAKYSLTKSKRRGSALQLPGVNRIEIYLGRMAFEFPYAGGGRVTPRTINGTLIGHDSETVVMPASMRTAFAERHRAAVTTYQRRINIATFKLDTLARRLEYTIDEEGIDRRFLFDGQFLFDAEELDKLLDPRCLIARADYAARLYLALRRLGFPRPSGRIMRNAIARVEEWARVNAARLPAWLSPANGRTTP